MKNSFSLEQRINPKIFRGIKLSRMIGRKLALEHEKGILDLYRNDFTLEQISNKYLNSDGHILNKGMAVNAVCYALKLVLPEKEREEIRVKRTILSRKKGGDSTYKRSKGIFNLSEEERLRNSILGGMQALKRKVGIHKYSIPEMKDVSSNGGKSAAKKRGQIPYDNECKVTGFGTITEKYYIIALRFTGEFDRYRGWSDLTDRINGIYNTNRTPNQVKDFYNAWRRRFSKRS